MGSLQPAHPPLRTCGTCFHRHRCPIGSSQDPLPLQEVTLARGARLASPGTRHAFVQVVRVGALKSRIWTRHGSECILGFYEGGDVIGPSGPSLDADIDVVALEASRVCQVSMDAAAGAFAVPSGRFLLDMLFEELDRARVLHIAVSRLPVRERLAKFLLELRRRQRQRQRGLRDDVLTLRMSREDIGNHLGARLETISREFSVLRRMKLIEIVGRRQIILEVGGLAALAGEPRTEST